MKKIKKYLVALLVCVMMFSMTAVADEVQTIADKTIVDNVENILTNYFTGYSAEMMAYVDENSYSGVLHEAAQSYVNALGDEEYGQFSKFSSEKVEQSSEEIIVNIVIEFEKGKIQATVKYEYIDKNPVPTSIEFSKYSDDEDSSFGTKMKNAGLNTLMGIFTVVAVLLLISAIISLFKYIPAIQEKFANKGNNTETKKDAVDKTIAQIAEKEELVDDLELVAVITAAIAAATGTSSDGFVVRSIKKAKRSR